MSMHWTHTFPHSNIAFYSTIMYPSHHHHHHQDIAFNQPETEATPEWGLPNDTCLTTPSQDHSGHLPSKTAHPLQRFIRLLSIPGAVLNFQNGGGMEGPRAPASYHWRREARDQGEVNLKGAFLTSSLQGYDRVRSSTCPDLLQKVSPGFIHTRGVFPPSGWGRGTLSESIHFITSPFKLSAEKKIIVSSNKVHSSMNGLENLLYLERQNLR